MTLTFRRATKIGAMLKVVATAGLLFVAALLGLTNWGPETATSPESTRVQTQRAQVPHTSPIKTRGSSPARLARDGRYFGYARAVNAHSRPRTLRFDVAQFFFGKDVQKAAEEDGIVRPGEAVSNDHYERNPSTHARSLTVANDAAVTAAVPASRLITHGQALARCRSECADRGIPVSPAEFFAAFEKKRYGMTAAGGPVWITIKNGLVVRIDEQYFP